MTLGEKLKQARQDRGLSQRQAAGEQITRNMLSLLESDRAKPSMRTLEYLAELYDRPVSWFLDDADAQTTVLDLAREAYRKQQYEECLILTAAVTDSDEGLLLRTLCALIGGRQALTAGRWAEAARLARLALDSVGAGLYGQADQLAQANLILARALLELDGDLTEAEKALTAAQIAGACLDREDLYRQILQQLALRQES